MPRWRKPRPKGRGWPLRAPTPAPRMRRASWPANMPPPRAGQAGFRSGAPSRISSSRSTSATSCPVMRNVACPSRDSLATSLARCSWDTCSDMNARIGTVAEIRIAKRTGFCYGVREAIDKAKEASAAGKLTHTLGQVVHNEGVISDLERLGIETVDTLDDVDHGAAVVIRAHGVRPDVMERANARGLEVIDGTCTWVIQEQKEIVKLVEEGYTIVLLGTPKHPEVIGLLGFAPERDRRRRGRGLGPGPAQEEDGPDLPVDAAALEVREACGVHGLAKPRAQDRQHGLPGHDPAPGGHDRDGPRGRHDGRGRRAVEREHEGADPPLRHRRDEGDPDRVREGPRRRRGLRGRQHRWRDRRHVDADRGPPRRRRADPGDRRDARGQGEGHGARRRRVRARRDTCGPHHLAAAPRSPAAS